MEAVDLISSSQNWKLVKLGRALAASPGMPPDSRSSIGTPAVRSLSSGVLLIFRPNSLFGDVVWMLEVSPVGIFFLHGNLSGAPPQVFGDSVVIRLQYSTGLA